MEVLVEWAVMAEWAALEAGEATSAADAVREAAEAGGRIIALKPKCRRADSMDRCRKCQRAALKVGCPRCLAAVNCPMGNYLRHRKVRCRRCPKGALAEEAVGCLRTALAASGLEAAWMASAATDLYWTKSKK